ncbi:MAG: aldehyde dehydrogenase family protein, partial [Mesorhizobium sp.]
FFPPSVLVDVPSDARCMNEEIFGPVAPLCKFKDVDEVIRLCNATQYGLAAYIYTNDMSKGLAVSEELQFGMIGLNRGLLSDPAAPFGGVKQSGIGREGAHEGMMEFMETQYISASW